MTRKPTLRTSRTRKAQAGDHTPAEVASAAPETSPEAKPGPKLAQLIALLQRPEGATVAQLGEALGWQAHSVRGAMAGALKARGHVVTSEVTSEGRLYRLPSPVATEATS